MKLFLFAAGWVALMVLTWHILPNWFAKRATRPRTPKKPLPAWVGCLFGGCLFGLPFLTAGPHAYLIAVAVVAGICAICNAEDATAAEAERRHRELLAAIEDRQA
jgi:hypothetical protein